MTDKKTLRDEFAMAALTGFLSSEFQSEESSSAKLDAKASYMYADAMMEARGDE